jgi:hypothetical protein
MKPPTFWADMGIGHLKINDVGDSTACPVAEGKERFTSAILLLHQIL